MLPAALTLRRFSSLISFGGQHYTVDEQRDDDDYQNDCYHAEHNEDDSETAGAARSFAKAVRVQNQ